MSILASKENNVGVYKITRPGQFGTTGYYARQYARLTSAYINLGYTASSENYWKYKYTTTECDQIIVRCEIPEGASGYILGFKASGTNKEFSIKIQNGTITYRIGNSNGTSATDRTTHAWEPGVHNIGFTSDMYAYFDGKIGSKLTPDSSYTAEGAAGYMLVGGWMNGSSAEAITSIDIYEVALSAYHNSTVNRSAAHYYAASSGNATTGDVIAVLYEARNPDIPNNRRYRPAAAVGSGSSAAGSLVTYGVQLHDLKFITSSGYRDLVAIMCEDWPEQASPDADDADVLNGPDGQTFTSAFCLRDMPLPAGWTRVARPDESDQLTIKYAKGDLIFGRKPKWHLWADNINVGKFTWDESNRSCFGYNIFYPRNNQQKPNLEQWEGYGNGAAQHHDPFIDFGIDIVNGLTVEYHNAVAALLNSATMIKAFSTSGSSTVTRDDYRVFIHRLPPLGSGIHMGLGDLVDWHKTASEQINDTNANINGGSKYAFSGIACIIRVGGLGEQNRVIGAAWMQTTARNGNLCKALSSDTPVSPTNEVLIFRDGKDDNNTYHDWDINLCGTEKDQDLLFHDIQMSGNEYVEAYALLGAIHNMAPMTPVNTDFNTQVTSAEYVLPIARPKLKRNDNPYIGDGATTHYRNILMTETVTVDGQARYIYPLFTFALDGNGYVGQQSTPVPIVNTSYDGGFRFAFALMYNALGTVLPAHYEQPALDIPAHTYKLSLELITVTKSGSSITSVTRSFLEKQFIGNITPSNDNSATNEQKRLFARFCTAHNPRPYYWFEYNAADVEGGSNFVVVGGNATDSGRYTDVTKLAQFVYIDDADIPAVHKIRQTTDRGGVTTISKETTCRLWIEKSDAMAPKVRVMGGEYMWDKAVFYKSYLGGDLQGLLVDRTPLLSLTSKTNPVNVNLESSDGEAISIQNDSSAQAYGLRIAVFRNWNDSRTIDSTNLICQFLVLRPGNDTDPSEVHYNYIAYGRDGSAWNDNGFTLEIVSGGWDYINFRITPPVGSTAGWGNNNLDLSLTRENSLIIV